MSYSSTNSSQFVSQIGSAQIRAGDEQRAGQLRCYPVPGCVRPRVAVQHHHRLPVAAAPYAQRHLADVDIFEREVFEHVATPTRTTSA
jgi:hypothetical protein